MIQRARGEWAFRFFVVAMAVGFVVQACGDSPPTTLRSLPDAGRPDSAAARAGTGGTTDTGGSAGTGGSTSTHDAASVPPRADAGTGRGKTDCKPNETECIGDRATRVCSPQGDWVTVPCDTGERCSGGKCAATKPCSPGDRICATDGATKACDNDGLSWVVTACGDGKICKDGTCAFDVGATCTPGESQCLDAKTRLRCTATGVGFDSVTCPASAPCVNGQCQGPVCALGTSACNFAAKNSPIRTCVDGVAFSEKPCPSGSTCQVVSTPSGPTAKCISTTGCAFSGQRACGDPTDPSVDTKTGYSECTFNQQTGTFAWVRVACEAPATCDPSSVGCSSTCVPGEKRCSGPSGYETCGTDGTWMPAQRCNTSSTGTLTCRPKPGTTDVACVDQLCAMLSNPTPVDGGTATPSNSVCDGAQVRQCDADGKLSPSSSCDVGVCRPTSKALVGGYHPGACSTDCKPGERRCVSDGLPLYLTCAADGTWSTAYQTCGSVCATAIDPSGLRTVLCGGECLPGSTRCSGDEVQTCDGAKKWLPSVPCKAGRCTMDSGSAVCRADCIPGTLACVGDARSASDGINGGSSAVATCTAQGLLPSTSTDCGGTQACRTSKNGIDLGCVECIGPSVAGGNDSGLVDSRCSTAGDSVQVCGAGNDWSVATGCGSGSSCFVGTARTCSPCANAPFVPGACTLSNVASAFGLGASCATIGLGTPTHCGDAADCCGGACTSAGGAFAFCAPSSFSPCLGSSDVVQLGSTAPQSTTGSTLFGDDTASPTCAFVPGSLDTAFAFTAPHAGTFAFDTFGSSIDTVLYVIDSLQCGELACNDNAQGLTSRALASLVSGQRVVIVVEGLGDFSLNVADTGQPGCGNGFADRGETCDGADLAGQTCASATLGALPGGTLACLPKCGGFDASGCTAKGGGGGSGGATGAGGAAGAGGAGSAGSPADAGP